MLAYGCSGADIIPAAPALAVPSGLSPDDDRRSRDGWLPWYFPLWQAGIGERIALDTNVESAVEADEVCEANLRFTWDARVSCK